MMKKILKVKKQGNNEEVKIKMEKSSKFSEDQLSSIKESIEKLKKLGEAESVNKEEFVKIVQELEASIEVKPKEKVDVKPEDKKDEEKSEDIKDSEGEDNDSKDKSGESEGEKSDEKTDDKKDDKKDSESDNKDDTEKDGEKKDDEKDKTPDEDKQDVDDISKHTAYKQLANEAVSKLKELEQLYSNEKGINENLTKENISLREEVSKFKQENHANLVCEVVEEISKFRDYSDEQKKEKHDEVSKMSDESLELMRTQFKELNVSRFENEEDVQTKHSQHIEDRKQEASKFQNTEIMEALKRHNKI